MAFIVELLQKLRDARFVARVVGIVALGEAATPTRIAAAAMITAGLVLMKLASD